MNTTSQTHPDKIQPNRQGNDSRVAPRRDELARSRSEVLRAGGRHKADIVKVDLGRGPIIVKDFSRKRWWWRRLGRLQIRRELAAYRHIGAVPGVPRLYGRVDADALALQWIDGGQLKTLPDRVRRGAFYVSQLEETVARIHATGLAHLDLRSNNNIVVRRDGRVYVLDFASAVRLRPGGLLHALLFPFLRALDTSGLLKWKRCLEPGRLTAADQARIERHERLSALWVLNRKQKPSTGRQNAEPPVAPPSSDA